MIKEVLLTIEKIAKERGHSRPFICGGVPRDKVLNNVGRIKDIDITTGDSTVHDLAKDVVGYYRNRNPEFKIHNDGHSEMNLDGLKIDFSSNFVMPNISNILKRHGLKNPTPMQKEMYSRDFTINALIMTMDMVEIKDPIGLGLIDANQKMIRTCFSNPEHRGNRG